MVYLYGISNRLVKCLSDIISKQLTVIINQTLTTGIFPKKLKLAKVIPLINLALVTLLN